VGGAGRAVAAGQLPPPRLAARRQADPPAARPSTAPGSVVTAGSSKAPSPGCTTAAAFSPHRPPRRHPPSLPALACCLHLLAATGELIESAPLGASAVLAVVVRMSVVLGTLTGPLGRPSAARLAVVPGAVGSSAHLPPAVGQREADLRASTRAHPPAVIDHPTVIRSRLTHAAHSSIAWTSRSRSIPSGSGTLAWAMPSTAS
jgi:hypothetical protein